MFGGNRVRIIGAHETDASPFNSFNNGMEDICRLLRAGDLESVKTRMNRIMREGVLPHADGPGTVPFGKHVDADCEIRLADLHRAFELFSSGELNEQTGSGRVKMAIYHLSERDVATFRRYLLHIEQLKEQAANEKNMFAKSVYDQRFLDGLLDRKLRHMAERWAKDLNARTLPMGPAEE
jgi:hypothetical protein